LLSAGGRGVGLGGGVAVPAESGEDDSNSIALRGAATVGRIGVGSGGSAIAFSGSGKRKA